MTPVKFSLALLALFGTLCIVTAKGKLTYGDECSLVSGVFSAITRSEDDEDKLCNGDKGLICTTTCSCAPTRVWDKGYIFGLFGTGSCVVGANGPCGKDDTCTSNAKCGDNVPVCQCNDGYHAHDSMCVSGSTKVSGISGLAFLGMIVSYYVFGN